MVRSVHMCQSITTNGGLRQEPHKALDPGLPTAVSADLLLQPRLRKFLKVPLHAGEAVRLRIGFGLTSGVSFQVLTHGDLLPRIL